MSYWNKRKLAFGYAFKGIAMLFKGEAHAKIHLVAACAVIIAGFLFDIQPWDWCAVIICIGGVFMGEAFNTALENLCNRVSTDFHPLIKAAKDISAGAVLLFVCASVAVGLIIFLPKIFKLIF